jgi:hypothetical protein
LLDGLSFATAAEFQAGLNKRIGDFYDNCHNFGSYIGRSWRRFSQESPPVFQRTSCVANSSGDRLRSRAWWSMRSRLSAHRSCKLYPESAS